MRWLRWFFSDDQDRVLSKADSASESMRAITRRLEAAQERIRKLYELETAEGTSDEH